MENAADKQTGASITSRFNVRRDRRVNEAAERLFFSLCSTDRLGLAVQHYSIPVAARCVQQSSLGRDARVIEAPLGDAGLSVSGSAFLVVHGSWCLSFVHLQGSSQLRNTKRQGSIIPYGTEAKGGGYGML